MTDFNVLFYVLGLVFWMFSKSSAGEAGGILIIVLGICIEYGVLKC